MQHRLSTGWTWAAISGAGFVALDLLALLLPGAPIKASDSAAHTVAALTGHRAAILAATLLGGLAALALLVFAGAVREWLEEGGCKPWLSAVAFGAPLLAIGLELAGFALFFGATFRVAGQHQDDWSGRSPTQEIPRSSSRSSRWRPSSDRSAWQRETACRSR